MTALQHARNCLLYIVVGRFKSIEMDVLNKLKEVNEKRSIEGFKMELTDWTLPEWGNAVAGEVGEMCNVIKKIKRGDFDSNPLVGKDMLQKEIADIIIYLDLIATKEGIDISQAIIDKFNEVSDRIDCNIKIN
jgi:NTP pyrophosphatase (non-canonical NTP hydrolase)